LEGKYPLLAAGDGTLEYMLVPKEPLFPGNVLGSLGSYRILNDEQAVFISTTRKSHIKFRRRGVGKSRGFIRRAVRDH
jgi:hypothetical protein